MNNIQNHQQTNFKGGFMIKSSANRGFNKQLRADLINALGSNKIIFDKFENKNNQMFCITRSYYKDKKFADFLAEQSDRLKFKYYPEITTRLKFEPGKPQELIDYIKTNASKPIETCSKLINYLKDIHPRTQALTKPVARKVTQQEEQAIFEFLNIKNAELKVLKKDTKKFVDSVNHSTIVISPKDTSDYCYVKVISNISTPDSMTKYYVFSFNGERGGYGEFKTIDEILQFQKLFNNACKK